MSRIGQEGISGADTETFKEPAKLSFMISRRLPKKAAKLLTKGPFHHQVLDKSAPDSGQTNGSQTNALRRSKK